MLIEIDGSIMEGGGQILRIAMALSAIKRIPVRIFNIRAERSKPGLAEQHLKGLLLVRDMCDGNLQGAEIGSTEIKFTPGNIKCGRFESRVRTAGSVALLMQIAIPCALFAPGPTTLALWGGTDADMAPPLDYFSQVISHIFTHFGAHFTTKVIKRGFFPRGGGEVQVEIQSALDSLKAANLTEPGTVTKVHGSSVVGGSCPVRVAYEMKKGAESVLLENYGSQTQPKISVSQGPADCPGSSILVVAETSSGCVLGASAIGNRSKSPHNLGSVAASELVAAGPGHVCLDNHAQDQVILLMALSPGTSNVLCGEMTLHTKTAMAIVEQMTKAKFEVKKQDSTSNIISCTGDVD